MGWVVLCCACGAKKANKSRKVPQQINTIVGNYRLRRAERSEKIPT